MTSTAWSAVLRQAASALLLTASASLFAAPASDPHTTTCRAVRGTIVPNCNAGICTQGAIQGDLRGTFTSKTTSIYRAGSGWLYSSWMRIEMEGKSGRIETLNEGTTPLDANGGPDLEQSNEVLTISEAEGAYDGVTGTLVIVGGHVLGRSAAYSGRLCRAQSTR